MKILILGGTRFLGRHLVDSARARGHDVTIFHRGRSHPRQVPDVEDLRGDRLGDLAPLVGRRWQAVIDTCGYTPAMVLGAAERLADAVEHYTFLSSVSVYAEFDPAGVNEKAPTKSLTAEELHQAEVIVSGGEAKATSYGALYGPLKARCEEVLEGVLPGRVLNVRPGLIVGPFDYTDRFTYWVRRVAEGGEVLAPGRPQRRVRVIDVRDVADWVVRSIETEATGVFNTAGPGTTLGGMLEECRAVSGSAARFTWVDEGFLLAEEVGPWHELPLWLPEEQNHFFEVDSGRALAAGLRCRPLAETIRDTLAWDRTAPMESRWEMGLDPVRERELLERFSRRVPG